MPRILAALPAFAILTALCGCGGNISSSSGGGGGGGTGGCTAASSSTAPAGSCPALVAQAGASFTGKVMAAQQAVSVAAVQLYAAGNAGNGSAPTVLLAAAITSGSDGSFTVPGGYACPSAETPIYLLSKGGAAGSGSANASLWLMTALGPCGSVAAGSSFVLNEVTTAASIWSLASFMSSGGKVGASCTNTAGLDNAFLTANALVDMKTGVSPGAMVPSTLIAPTKKLNTLANALASCTRSGGSGCSGLFAAAAAGSTTPSNTVDAALNLARAPGNNAAAIYSLASANTVYAPALSAAPPDLMLHNTIEGGGMASPASAAVAASGDVWVSSYFNTVSEFSPAGAAEFTSGITGNGINQSYGMALDATGNVWVANEQTGPNNGSGDVDELSSAGAALETNLTAGGIDFPIAVAADTTGNVWFADYGDSKVTVLDGSTGSAVSSSGGWGGSTLAFPVALAVDASHNAWVANQAGITKVSADGSEVTNYDCHCDGPSGVAVDQGGNVWIANYYGNSISEVNSCGTLELGALAGGGVDHPQGIAVDGGGTVWVTNFLSNSISELSGAMSSTISTPGTFLSPSTGFGTDASILQPYGLAIDASGNIWVSNFGNSTLTEFVGVAAPVKTPLVGPPQAP
jgi:streptogramin lyase